MNHVLPSGLSVPFACLISCGPGLWGEPEELFELFMSYVADIVTEADRDVLITKFASLRGLSAHTQEKFNKQMLTLQKKKYAKGSISGYG